MRKSTFKRLFAMTLAATMIVTLAPQNLLETIGVITEAEAATALSNPRIVVDSSITYSKQNVTWDCVWFGSYPQTEIVDQASTSGCYDREWACNGDYEVNESLYTTLQNATTYDANGDITIENTKYRRIRKADATNSGISSNYYEWSDSTTYHYFRYDPIKWRVLKTDGNQALLLANKTLDDQRYNTSPNDVTWKTCTMRSWLNGYGSSSNIAGINYSSKNFIDTAFTSSEKNAINTSSVINANNNFYGTAGGDNTNDKVFLLSESEVYNSDQAKAYGFVTNRTTTDEARRMKATSYAKAMGLFSPTSDSYLGNSLWWLRTPGWFSWQAMAVNNIGFVTNDGCNVSNNDNGCCPALNLNLSSSDSWSFAGVVCSDGNVNEKAESGSSLHVHLWGTSTVTPSTVFAAGNQTKSCTLCGAVETTPIAKLAPTIKLSKTKVTLKKNKKKNKSITIKVTNLAAGDFVKSWKSSKKKVATVNAKGKIVAKKKGKATITVTLASGKKATVKVTVK